MIEQTASRTAMVTSMMRACHARLDDTPLIDDPWGDRLVPEAFREGYLKSLLARMDPDARARALALPGSVIDDHLRSSSAYATVILRSRFAEDALEASVTMGVRQYVLIGAGFDSFALRRPAFAQALDVYEVDHPATQGFKRRRLQECGIPISESTHYIAADLGAEDLESALSRSPFRADRPSFLSWLGVTMYLGREANLATLRSIARCAAPDSELVFTYVDERVFDPRGQSADFRKMRQAVATIGEPFLSGFDPANLSETLQPVGLALAEDLNGEQLVERYRKAGASGMVSSTTSHIARACVVSAFESRAPRTR